jgi:predicted AAA+ superfamily ATPase
LFSSYKGALAENMAAQMLQTAGKQCFYWTSAGNAEVDFLFQKQDRVIGLEVKSGHALRSRSLKELGRQFPNVALYRSSLLNADKSGAIENIPAYQLGQYEFN